MKPRLGRPKSTGSVHIAFRLHEAEVDKLAALGKSRGLSAASMAKVYVRLAIKEKA